jgi:hypothetical protein
MRKVICYLLTVLTGAAAGTPTASGSDQPQPAPVINNTVETTVRFDLYQGYLIVSHGSVGRLKNLNFFLDTGTSVPIVDLRIAGKLNLQDQAPSNIVILGGRARGGEVTLPSLEFGPVQRSNVHATTTDLSFFQKVIPVRIDAIVGLDVLGQSAFVIDYSARVIRFGPPPAMAISIPLRLDGGLATFDAEIDHAPVHLLFDTGASSLVLFETGAPGSSERVDAVQGTESIGSYERKAVWLRTLRLGREEFRKAPAVMVRNPKQSQLDFDGLMSPSALGVSRVSVDLKQGVLAFSR